MVGSAVPTIALSSMASSIASMTPSRIIRIRAGEFTGGASAALAEGADAAPDSGTAAAGRGVVIAMGTP